VICQPCSGQAYADPAANYLHGQPVYTGHQQGVVVQQGGTVTTIVTSQTVQQVRPPTRPRRMNTDEIYALIVVRSCLLKLHTKSMTFRRVADSQRSTCCASSRLSIIRQWMTLKLNKNIVSLPHTPHLSGRTLPQATTRGRQCINVIVVLILVQQFHTMFFIMMKAS
jgi:hypothetical protein